MKRIRHWQDYVSVLVGIWLMVSPWALGIHGNLAAIGNSVVIGAVMVAFAVVALFIHESWEEWSEIVLGLWLMGSPWILEFTGIPIAMQNALLCGGLITVLALWVLGTDDDFGGWFHRLTG
jgi:hypothetical protein